MAFSNPLHISDCRGRSWTAMGTMGLHGAPWGSPVPANTYGGLYDRIYPACALVRIRLSFIPFVYMYIHICAYMYVMCARAQTFLSDICVFNFYFTLFLCFSFSSYFLLISHEWLLTSIEKNDIHCGEIIIYKNSVIKLSFIYKINLIKTSTLIS